MSCDNKLRREILKMIEHYGGAEASCETGKHHKFRFLTPEGKTAMVVVSVSASDKQHALKNTESLIRKALR